MLCNLCLFLYNNCLRRSIRVCRRSLQAATQLIKLETQVMPQLQSLFIVLLLLPTESLHFLDGDKTLIILLLGTNTPVLDGNKQQSMNNKVSIAVWKETRKKFIRRAFAGGCVCRCNRCPSAWRERGTCASYWPHFGRSASILWPPRRSRNAAPSEGTTRTSAAPGSKPAGTGRAILEKWTNNNNHSASRQT